MHNSPYSLWLVNSCQQSFRSVASLGFCEQKSASKPPQDIAKPLGIVQEKMRIRNYISITFTALTLISCDSVNHLHYAVENKTNEKIRIHAPSYPIDQNRGEFSAKVDTIIEISPNETLWVGTSAMDIDFPWATKNIYRKSPGICGLELVENDTLFKLDCTDSSWKYNKRWSTLKIK